MNTMLKFSRGDKYVRISVIQKDGRRAIVYVSTDFIAESGKTVTEWDGSTVLKMFTHPKTNVSYIAIHKMHVGSNGDISGHVFTAEIDAEHFNKYMIYGGKYIDVGQFRKYPKVVLNESAQRKLKKLTPAERNALRKFFRHGFQWPGGGEISIYGDFGMDFYFCEEHGICGGICRHVRTTKKGYEEVEYSMHT